MKQKKLSIMLTLIIVINLLCMAGIHNKAYAKSKKPLLTSKKVQLNVGKTKTIKLKNAPKKVKWKVANKKVAKIVKKSGKKSNIIKIKGLKAGKTKITATCSGKKYVVTVKVKKYSSKTKPTSTDIKETTRTVQETTQNVVETTVIEEITTVEQEPTNKVEETTTYDDKYCVRAKLKDALVKLGDDLNIYFVAENKEYTYGYEPGTLEIYDDESRGWKELKVKDDAKWTDIAGVISSDGTESLLTVPLNDYYEDIQLGEYRYTHQVSGIKISVDFVIVDPQIDFEIIATVGNDKIKNGEDLEIIFTVKGNTGELKPGFGYVPEAFEKYENGKWQAVSLLPGAGYSEIQLYTQDGVGTLYVPLQRYYGDLPQGHYRWIHIVEGKETIVEFDIVE